MENKEQQILSEIKSMIASVRNQLEMLDAKLLELQQTVVPEDMESAPIDLEIDDLPTVPVTSAPEPAVAVPEPAVAVPEPVAVELEIPLAIEEDLSEDLPDDLPEAAPSAAPVPVVDAPAAPIVADMLTARQAWRKDMPGAPVKDIRSAISLNDRVIFINHLFDEDPMAFQEMLTRINGMTSLDEVVDLVRTEHPEWDMDSEVIYRFMMAVRRKIR